jgi:hypothetical protein
MGQVRPPDWVAELDEGLAALGSAAAADDWVRALELAEELQRRLVCVTLTPTSSELAAVQRASAVLQHLAGRVSTCRDATATALRDLHLGQRAVQAYR